MLALLLTCQISMPIAISYKIYHLYNYRQRPEKNYHWNVQEKLFLLYSLLQGT